jgi:transcriptional regulator with XRE-family HTH domain
MTAAQEELLARVRARRVVPIAAERKRIREAAGVSQHELAKALGVSWTAIWRWEQGSRPREHEHEVAYADLLNELKRVAAA